MTGAELISAERSRQIHVEGFTPQRDQLYSFGTLSTAAFVYLGTTLRMFGLMPMFAFKFLWPWDPSWFKPSSDPVRNLTKAGALIAAEIDLYQVTTRGEDSVENYCNKLMEKTNQYMQDHRALVSTCVDQLLVREGLGRHTITDDVHINMVKLKSLLYLACVAGRQSHVK